ncbi:MULTISPECIES: HlyD family secretion protein [Pasteurellaceae]|uniref:Biotin/lipoyl-binding protein n=1 Tax=Pasteurella atlantica TaxID=2827233 RepID=A0AAW8CRB4_9PAST|nr:biotin/lipoyl-binding protein [Pasteurella atlantica]MBR0574259.1 efflux RND transporter periplasmic adaptor subunit [Pasteurella atlantica]MDP8040163.1 biotin/lipoyl-binding protein [Pasteurella atlantica]MDP8042314.1 biotin/lipoyl-binding protein [Pasteurella atlantica]MDP8044469.1 biotin/lipoyl-binding protein [Pasteurella atlantica]MDP8046519.1 biotin/lipoyl-binding protein [Pasteurella atlantica]
MKENTKKALKPILGLVILGLVIVFIICGYLKVSEPEPVVLQGQMEAHEVNIASKISGRIDKIYIQEGDKITKGSPILHFDSPEIAAKVAQAEAVRDAASSVANKAEAGARTQEKEMAFKQMQRAKAGLDVMNKTWKRVNTLTKEGLLSQQKADEVKAKYLSSQKLYEIAKAQYEMAQEGARKEDISAAKAKARQGQAVFDEALVAKDEMQLKSPVDGEIAEIIPNVGEIIAKGVPVVTVVNLQEQRLELNVREDYLKYFAINQTFEGTIPALDNLKVTFKVYASSVLPDFATWRPTRTDQGFDMRTFLVKSHPEKPIEKMRPGMSVLVELPRGK